MVAPKGMFEPIVAVPVAPDVASSDADAAELAPAVPALAVDDAPAPQVLETFVPPPSNAGFKLALPQDEISGLMPGVFSSVAPRGMPPPEDDVSEEDGVPSGVVAPMPRLGVVCACAAAMVASPSNAAIMRMRHIANFLSDRLRSHPSCMNIVRDLAHLIEPLRKTPGLISRFRRKLVRR